MSEPLVNELRGIPQRVAQQLRFDATVKRVSTKFRSLKAEIRSQKKHLKALARAAFFPDAHVLAIDGTRLPVRRKIMMRASPVLRSMLSAGFQEQHQGEIKTEFVSSALRVVLSTLHYPALDVSGEQPFAVLLAACKICDVWVLPEALVTLATKMTSKEAATANPSPADWIAALSAAKMYTAANSPNQVWQEVAEEAARALALAMPAAASAEGFANLDFTAVCQVMRYMQDATIELPSFTVCTRAPDFSKADGVLLTDSDPFSVNCVALRLRASKKNESDMTVLVHAIQEPSKLLRHGFIVGSLTLSINHPEGATAPMQKTRNVRAVSKGFPIGHTFLGVEGLDALLMDGACIVKGVFKIAAEQRQYELFNRWLIDSGRIEAPLSIPAALACLRACVSGINPQEMTVATLKTELQSRALSFEGPKKELQVRLADAVSVETQRNTCEEVGIACKSLAMLIACNFDSLCQHNVDNLCELDALDAASLSLVLCDDRLEVNSEEKLLQVVTRWAKYPGRVIEMVDKVMPLVRFLFICSLTLPSPELKALLQASSILPALVKEALELQLTPLNKRKREDGWGTFTPQKFALIEGVLEEETVPRNKRRLFCIHDKVPCLDPAQQLYSAVFQTP